MKPKDLRSPFAPHERTTCIDDRIWYIAGHRPPEEFTFPGWHTPQLFDSENPVYLEYCSGNGCWIADQARKQTDVNWVAVEMKWMRVKKIWSKIKNFSLANLVVVNGEGHAATENYFPDNSVAAVYINFPDPWPKRRHEQKRLIQPTFVDQLARILKENGSVVFVTDDDTYSEWTIEIFTRSPHFSNAYPSSGYITEWPGYGDSTFNALWRSQGKTIRYHQFVKTDSAS